MSNLISRDEWNEWFGMPQTKQFLSELDKYKEDKLYSTVINLSAGNDASAKISAGCVIAMQEVNNILMSLKPKEDSGA